MNFESRGVTVSGQLFTIDTLKIIHLTEMAKTIQIKLTVFLTAIIILPFLVLPVHATEPRPPIIFELGLHQGGEYIPTNEMTFDGYRKVRAGKLLSGRIGYQFSIADNLLLTPSLGLKLNSNERIFSDRTTHLRVLLINLPLEIAINEWRIEAGITLHKAELEARTSSVESKLRFDASAGLYVGFMLEVGEKHLLGLRYTEIEYQYANTSPVDASNFGLFWRILYDHN